MTRFVLCAVFLALLGEWSSTPTKIDAFSPQNYLSTVSSRNGNGWVASSLFATVEGEPSTKKRGELVDANKITSTTVAAVPKLAQRWRKSTKQLATLGPASSSKEMIEKLFLAGADVFRLNFSHGSQEQKQELLLTIREIEEQYSHPIAVLGDLQGPKLRVSLTYTYILTHILYTHAIRWTVMVLSADTNCFRK